MSFLNQLSQSILSILETNSPTFAGSWRGRVGVVFAADRETDPMALGHRITLHVSPNGTYFGVLEGTNSHEILSGRWRQSGDRITLTPFMNLSDCQLGFHNGRLTGCCRTKVGSVLSFSFRQIATS